MYVKHMVPQQHLWYVDLVTCNFIWKENSNTTINFVDWEKNVLPKNMDDQGIQIIKDADAYVIVNLVWGRLQVTNMLSVMCDCSL